MSDACWNLKQYLPIIKEQWLLTEQIPGIFSYKLNVTSTKNLSGQYGFYIEFNPQRTQLRRPPQIINLLNPEFNDLKFNFTKVDIREKLVSFNYRTSYVTIIINKSPLTKYHSLICVDLEKKIPQKINHESLQFCVDFLLQINDRRFRIGYNSPGAFASVNHLHLHLIYLKQNLFIENLELQPLVNGIYEAKDECFIQPICFLFNSCKDDVKLHLKKLETFLEWLCAKNIPHNMFMTKDIIKTDRVKVFVFAKEKPNSIKRLNVLNTAFCELSGYFPVGDKYSFDNITECDIVEKICEEVGNIHLKLRNYILCLK